jgi:flagellar hook-associated protein 3 FlgL
MVKPIPSFLVATLTRNDLSRITTQIYDLQRQTGSGNIADDLKGYGQEAGRIVSARTAISQSEARVAAANRLVSRLEIQDAALGKAAGAAATLQQQIQEALASDNATYLKDQITLAFQQITEGFNTTYEGVSLFAGERRGGAAVQISEIGDLTAALQQSTLFEESTRAQTIDLGVGGPLQVADKVSDIARPLYGTLRDLYVFATTSGAGAPMTAEQRSSLQGMLTSLDAGRQNVVEAQGVNGDRQARLERAVVRLESHADLLTKHLGAVAEADLAEVAMRLSAAQTQYQAAASVFSQIKDLSLINFLD